MRVENPAHERRRSGIQLSPDPYGEKHESRNRFYQLFPAHDRRLGVENGGKVAGGWVASSARLRYEKDGGYRPPGLQEWLDDDGDVTDV